MAPLKKGVIWAAIIAALVAFGVWSVEEGEKFSCRAGSHQLAPGEGLFAVASKFCEGNLQNAVLHIMEHNGIKREELGDLRVNLLIVIPRS